MLKENERKVLELLTQEEYWKPQLTEISKVTGYAITTIHDIIKRLSKAKPLGQQRAKQILELLTEEGDQDE